MARREKSRLVEVVGLERVKMKTFSGVRMGRRYMTRTTAVARRRRIANRELEESGEIALCGELDGFLVRRYKAMAFGRSIGPKKMTRDRILTLPLTF